MVIGVDSVKKRVTLSTKKLEPRCGANGCSQAWVSLRYPYARSPGDMIRNKQVVFSMAEEMAAAFRERVKEAEAKALANKDYY